MERAPKGKLLLIGSEDVEVWPTHCVDGHRCIRCYFTGMKGCAPRFWRYASRLKHQSQLPEAPSPPHDLYKPFLVRLETLSWKEGSDILTDTVAGQPLYPIPDGGFTEETTNAVMSSPFSKRQLPWREIDHDCDGCGCPYLAHYKNPKGKIKELYRCIRCGRTYSKDTQLHRISARAKEKLRKLREQGITIKATISLIHKELGEKMSVSTYTLIVEEMGLPLRKQGWFGDKERHIATRLGKRSVRGKSET